MSNTFKSAILVFLMAAAVLQASADQTPPRGIRMDGSIGTAGKLDLPGPDYEIRAEYGQQVGANLFHSFEQFNVHSLFKRGRPECHEHFQLTFSSLTKQYWLLRKDKI